MVSIKIDGIDYTTSQITDWQNSRCLKVRHNLSLSASSSEESISDLNRKKIQMSYDEIVWHIKGKLLVGKIGIKLAVLLSFGKRRFAVTQINATGIHIAAFGKIIDDLMLNPTEDNRAANLSVCPDHYVLMPHGDTLEVIETTGNCPVPTQFFITFHDEEELQSPRNNNYPYQSVGIARLRDGTIIGGVRHQFKDTVDGIEGILTVEFPWMCPAFIVKEHQKHLAAEWSGWIQWAVKHQ